MKTLFLPGAAGYIGSHCALELIQAGYQVVILDNLSNTTGESIKNLEKLTGVSIPFYTGNMGDFYLLEHIFKKHTIDGVIQFAGLKSVGQSCENPFLYYENNVCEMITLCKVMENFGVKNIIFSSSATVYSKENPLPLTEESKVGNTENPYGTTKIMIENILRDLSMHKNWNVIHLRYFNPIGADISGLLGENPIGIPNNLLPYILKVASGELSSLSIFGDDYETPDGTGMRDYIHVTDLALAHIAAYNWLTSHETKSSLYEIFNLGTGKSTSVLEMKEIVETITQKNISYEIKARRTGDIANVFCSPEKAKNILGWTAQKTIQEGIRDSWNFIQKKC